ncbi:ribbon-helix-helix domain-containing protein [Paenibacillus sp. FSL M7-0420]|uniref:ribbon-helix-helix domain-containing protein n=1 Tax=Paenibacillus sp. FSL M7-0420 TaxID=2921609 RepID=UPI0030FC88FE
MVEKDKTRLTVYFPPSTKEDLKDMAEQTGLSQTQLVVIATHSLIENYKMEGNAIFKNLIMKPK